jgi:hypothetical protein
MNGISRRHFLAQTAAATLLRGESAGPHHKATAKAVIFLYMPGGPSQLDLFDEKPMLREWHGKPLPPSATKGLKLAFIKSNAQAVASPHSFQRCGQSGAAISDLLPHLKGVADELSIVRGLHTNAFNHDPGELELMTGHMQAGRPSMGSWIVNGLGAETKNLPSFVVLNSGTPPSAGANNWSAGFLPSSFQGTPLRTTGEPIPFLATPTGWTQRDQRARLDLLRALNEQERIKTGDAEIEARIRNYELAFRMQSAAPELLDFSRETKSTLDLYGVNKEPTHSFASNCLLARRMVERGVRFVLLSHGSWDDHNDIDKNLAKNCAITDQPAAALIADLKRLGMLDSTLVVWGGEFGRTPMSQQQRSDLGYGRDHHPDAFTMWLAGGGIRAGQTIGRTDDFGLQVVEDKMHVHDLQATILHCLGLDHEKLTYRHMGRDFRLTDVDGHVVRKLLVR